jgi:hypothetical protein
LGVSDAVSFEGAGVSDAGDDIDAGDDSGALDVGVDVGADSVEGVCVRFVDNADAISFEDAGVSDVDADVGEGVGVSPRVSVGPVSALHAEDNRQMITINNASLLCNVLVMDNISTYTLKEFIIRSLPWLHP